MHTKESVYFLAYIDISSKTFTLIKISFIYFKYNDEDDYIFKLKLELHHDCTLFQLPKGLCVHRIYVCMKLGST